MKIVKLEKFLNFNNIEYHDFTQDRPAFQLGENCLLEDPNGLNLMFYNSSKDRSIFIDIPLSTVDIAHDEVFAMLHFLPKDIEEVVFNVKAFTSGVIIKHAKVIETLNLIPDQTLDNLKIMCFTPGIFASFLNKCFGFEYLNGYGEYSADAILITSYTDLYQHAITNTNRIFRKKDLVNFDLQI